MTFHPKASPVSVGMGYIKLTHQFAHENFVCNSRHELAKRQLIVSGGTALDQRDLTRGLGPDVMILTRDLVGIFVIEVTRSRDVSRMFRKGLEYARRYPDVQEYFVFDFERQILYAPNEDMTEWYRSTDIDIYSDFLSKPVVEYFKFPEELLPLYALD